MVFLQFAQKKSFSAVLALNAVALGACHILYIRAYPTSILPLCGGAPVLRSHI